MLELFNTWQFNIVGFLICIIGFFQFYKLAVKNATYDGAATVLLQFIAGASALSLALLFPFHFSTDLKTYRLLLVACVFYALFDRLQTTVRKHLEVSIFSILNQFTTVFLILFGITIFREPLVPLKLMGAGLVILGNVVVFLKGKALNLNKYAWIGITSTLVFATAISIDVGISSQFNLPFYIAITLIAPAFMIMVAERHKLTEVLSEYKPEARTFYLATGISWALSIFFSLRSYQYGSVTTVAPLQATSVILNVLIAYLFLKERDDKVRKVFAALLVVAGVYLTAIS